MILCDLVIATAYDACLGMTWCIISVCTHSLRR